MKVQGNFKVYTKYIFNIFIPVIYINKTLLGSIGNLTENNNNYIYKFIQLFENPNSYTLPPWYDIFTKRY